MKPVTGLPSDNSRLDGQVRGNPASGVRDLLCVGLKSSSLTRSIVISSQTHISSSFVYLLVYILTLRTSPYRFLPVHFAYIFIHFYSEVKVKISTYFKRRH